MLNDLFERHAAFQAQVEKFTPIREVFEEFLRAGQRKDAGPFWRMDPVFDGNSRYNWERQQIVTIPVRERRVVVKAFTNSRSPQFGHKAGNIEQALINVIVSLAENPIVDQELELPPLWALQEQDPDLSPQNLDELEKNLEEIVPLVRACLSQD